MNPNTGRFWTMDTDEGDQEDPLSLHKYLYAADNPINRLDPSGHDFELPTTLTATTAATIIGLADVAVVSQTWVNYVRYLGLTPQDRAAAIAQNNQAVAMLQAIIDSDGEITFQQENLVVGGKLGMVLPGGGAFQSAANVFEERKNIEGWPSAGD